MAGRDAEVIASGVPEAVLVERAGAAVARAARERLGGTYGRRVVVVAGKGNNGADGLVAARRLAARGVRVDVFELSAGVDEQALTRSLARADLFVDAMYGTGFRGVLEGDAAAVAAAVEASGVDVLAVDIPSGVDGTTGAVGGPVVHADATVAFAAYKPGLLFTPGAQHAGEVRIVDIGIDPGPVALGLVGDDDLRRWLPVRPATAHKWSVGGVFVVGGSAGMAGAAALSARAALRAGAGIVVCGLAAAGTAPVAGDEVITRRLAATDDGHLAEEAVPQVRDGLERFRAVVLGPGLGTDPATVAAVRRLVAEIPVPLVLDADGLNAIGRDVAPLSARAPGTTVLTPHAGEYQRLAGGAVGDDRVAAARTLAVGTGAVVLLKGPQTVVAEPGGRAAVVANGGPWLATAGTGDVLAGIIGALLAQGLAPFEAAAAGAFLHGRAARAARSWFEERAKTGNPGLVAGDLIDALPSALLAR
jgi:NAD(P)H-hydrate epimerase